MKENNLFYPSLHIGGKGNTFAVSDGGTVRIGHNEIVDVRTALKAGVPYAGFIAVGSGGGHDGEGMLSLAAVVAASPAEYNSDPARGALYAVYTARLTDELVPPGTTVGEVGLCGFASGRPLSDYAAIEPIVKRAGVDIVVRAEIELNLPSDDLLPSAGENALVAALLGRGKLGTFELARGGNQHYNDTISRGEGNIFERVPAAAEFTEAGLTISGSFSGAPYEYIVLMDGRAVLRGFCIVDVTITDNNSVLSPNSSVERAGEDIISVSYVTKTSQSATPHYHIPYPVAITADCPDLIPGKISRTARFICDPAGACVALRDGREITVYALLNNRLRELYRLSRIEGYASLAADGSLLVAGGQVTLYRYDIRDGSLTAVPIDYPATEAHLTFEAGEHRIALLSGTTFYLMRVQDGVPSVIETVEDVPGDFGYTRHDRYFIDFWSATKKLYRSDGVSGACLNNRQRIRDFCCKPDLYRTLARSDIWVEYVDLGDGLRKFMDIEGNSPRTLADNQSVMFAGEFAFVLENGDLAACYTWTGSTVETREVPLGVTLRGVKDIAAIGEYFLVLDGEGRAVTLYAAPGGVRIFAPYLGKSDHILFGLICADDPRYGSPSARIAINIAV